MKKYRWLLILAFCLCVIPSFHKAEAAGVNLFLNGERLNVSKSASGEMMNGKVMIPLRVIGEQLGYKFEWAPKEYKVTIHKGNTDIAMYVGRTTAYVGNKEVKLDTPALLRGSSTFVPLRFVGEQLDLSVKWDNIAKAVYLQKHAAKEQGKESDSKTAKQAASGKTDKQANTGTGKGINEAGTDVVGIAREVRGISFKDNQLTVLADEGSEPTVITITNPDRIIVDFKNMRFAEALKKQYPVGSDGSSVIGGGADGNVQFIRFAQFTDGPAAARIVLVLTSAKGYSVTKGNGAYVIALNNPPSPDKSAGSAMIPSVQPGQTADPSVQPGQTADPSVQPSQTADPSVQPGQTADPPAQPGQTVTPPVQLFNPAVPSGQNGRWLVVLDPGHGGKDPGAFSMTGRTEKEFNLAVALKVQERLQGDAGIALVLTRNSDTYPTLAERSSLANSLHANVFVSIHANSMPKTATGMLANGSETYYTKADSKGLAVIMQKYLTGATGFKDNGVKAQSLHVTRETQMPAVLLEAGYLSNVDNEAALYGDDTQNRIADGIVSGLREYLGSLR